MQMLAERSAAGERNSFSGLFGLSELTEQEKSKIETLLEEFSTGKENLSQDLSELTQITSEVKAINHQAALLHGERIKKANDILKKYKDGAFTGWLIATYGNRQTPYNLLQYYEFYEALPKPLKPKAETMPRQAIYTLASREGEFEKKLGVVEGYAGETKTALLALIRELFPLKSHDKRRQNLFYTAMVEIEKVRYTLGKIDQLTHKQKEELQTEYQNLKTYIERIHTR